MSEAAGWQAGRAADDEVAGTEQRLLPDEDLAGVHQARQQFGLGSGSYRDLQVFGCPTVGDVGRLIQVAHEHATTVASQRRTSRFGASSGQGGELPLQLHVDRVGEHGAGRDEQHRAVGAVLGFVQQVGRRPASICAVIGDDHALGGAQDHHRRHSIALHLHLRTCHRRAAGTDDLAHSRNGLGAEPQRGDAGGAVDPEDVGDAQLAAHDEDRGVDATAAVGHGGHHQRERGHPRDRGRHRQLVGDTGVAGLPAGHEEAGAGDGRDLLTDGEAGLALEAPIGCTQHQLFVEGAQVGDCVVDRSIHLGIDVRVGQLAGGGTQLVRLQRHLVEVAQRSTHGLVAIGTHIVDDATDRRLQFRIEDGSEPAITERLTVGLAHRGPGHPSHHRHGR